MEDNMEDGMQKKSITERIIASTKDGSLKMKPRWHFILRASLAAVGTALVLLSLLYFASLFAFILRKTGILAAPFFGWHGIFVFLSSLPWLLIGLVFVFIVILEILVCRYSFAYRVPLLYSALAILAALVAASIFIDRTPFHRMLSNCPPGGGLMTAGRFHSVSGVPCAMGFYRDLRPGRFGNIHDGVITEIIAPDIIIINRQQESLTVKITSRTRLPFGGGFSAGDAVAVIGERRGNLIEAFGVSLLDDWERRKKR